MFLAWYLVGDDSFNFNDNKVKENNMAGKTWKKMGFCKARHIDKHNEYHNAPTGSKSEKRLFCYSCKCQVPRCEERWAIYDINGKRCSKHRNIITQHDVGNY